ncbi:hypothetical protein RCL1_001355 [Eukaryota sp. TZLM3-RCL]
MDLNKLYAFTGTFFIESSDQCDKVHRLLGVIVSHMRYPHVMTKLASKIVIDSVDSPYASAYELEEGTESFESETELSTTDSDFEQVFESD